MLFFSHIRPLPWGDQSDLVLKILGLGLAEDQQVLARYLSYLPQTLGHIVRFLITSVKFPLPQCIHTV